MGTIRKSDLVRTIYAELRQNVASEISDGDLLRLANLIVQAHGTDPNLLAGFGVAAASRTLLSLPLDEAMDDGGWRVLFFEVGGRGDEDEVGYGESHFPRIRSLLGPEWRHHRWNGPL